MKSASRCLFIPVILSLVLASGCGQIKTPPVPTETAIASPTVQVPEQIFTPEAVAEIAPTPEASITDADLALAFGDFREAYKLYSGTLRQDTDEGESSSIMGWLFNLAMYKQWTFSVFLFFRFNRVRYFKTKFKCKMRTS